MSKKTKRTPTVKSTTRRLVAATKEINAALEEAFENNSVKATFRTVSSSNHTAGRIEVHVFNLVESIGLDEASDAAEWKIIARRELKVPRKVKHAAKKSTNGSRGGIKRAVRGEMRQKLTDELSKLGGDYISRDQLSERLYGATDKAAKSRLNMLIANAKKANPNIVTSRTKGVRIDSSAVAEANAST